MSDVLLAKLASIQRSVSRAREEAALAGGSFETDHSRQDAAVLNILRACEQSLDVANIVISEQRIGVPQSSRDSFRLLAQANMIDQDLADRLQRMIGFRDIAVHQYQALSVPILKAVLGRDLDDLLEFSRCIATLRAS